MSNKIYPALFISHGAPSLAIERNSTVTFLGELGRQLGKPRAIVCVSAHWTTTQPTASATEQPETIHDFGGFPEALYQMRYPAPGAPAIASRVAELLEQSGIEHHISPERGLDHGAWIPLMLMRPEADIPVLQLSVQPYAGPAAHFRIGQALAPLRREGILVLASGSAVHNLSHLGSNNGAPEWAAQFDDWLYQKITDGSYKELINYRKLAPHAALAHPTEEHLLPLFVAMGAGFEGENPHGHSLHRGWTYGSISMAAYQFGGERIDEK